MSEPFQRDNDLPADPLVRIVCACCKSRRTGLVIAGTRHRNKTMQSVIEALDIPGDSYEDGFLTNTEEFVSRAKAWMIAEAAGQIRPHPSQTPGKLHSEDLY